MKDLEFHSSDPQPSLLQTMINQSQKDIELTTLRERVRELEARIDVLERIKFGFIKANSEIEQALGRALRYPRFCDDQKNFPCSTDNDGVCVGDHVAESIADEAANRIRELEEAMKRMIGEHEPGSDCVATGPKLGTCEDYMCVFCSGKKLLKKQPEEKNE